MTNNHLTLMICFARSGGTILNQCLGSLPNTVIMSEVNPLGGGWGVLGKNSYTSVKSQAKNWFNITLKSEGFTNETIDLYHYCKNNNKTLLLRDWTFINFSSHDYNHFNPPNDFLTLKELDNKIPIKAFAFVRNAIDVWISRGMPEVETFFKEYLNYVEKLIEYNIPYFKYEDFCKSPAKVIKKLCNNYNLNYSNEWRNFSSFDKVNGDVQIRSSKNNHKDIVATSKRKIVPNHKMKELKRCSHMIKANKLLNYETNCQEIT